MSTVNLGASEHNERASQCVCSCFHTGSASSAQYQCAIQCTPKSEKLHACFQSKCTQNNLYTFLKHSTTKPRTLSKAITKYGQLNWRRRVKHTWRNDCHLQMCLPSRRLLDFSHSLLNRSKWRCTGGHCKYSTCSVAPTIWTSAQHIARWVSWKYVGGKAKIKETQSTRQQVFTIWHHYLRKKKGGKFLCFKKYGETITASADYAHNSSCMNRQHMHQIHILYKRKIYFRELKYNTVNMLQTMLSPKFQDCHIVPTKLCAYSLHLNLVQGKVWVIEDSQRRQEAASCD